MTTEGVRRWHHGDGHPPALYRHTEAEETALRQADYIRYWGRRRGRPGYIDDYEQEATKSVFRLTFEEVEYDPMASAMAGVPLPGSYPVLRDSKGNVVERPYGVPTNIAPGDECPCRNDPPPMAYVLPRPLGEGIFPRHYMEFVEIDGVWRVRCEWCHGTGRIVGWRKEPEYIGWVQTHPDAVPDLIDDDRRPEEADGEDTPTARNNQAVCWEVQEIGYRTSVEIYREDGIKVDDVLPARPRECSILAANPDLRARALADAGYFAPPQDRGRGFIESGAIVFD